MRGLGRRAFILGATGTTALAVMPFKARAAATINAASGLQPDIQAAVNLALPGDTVQIPAGTFAFTGQVFAPDGIHIKGAGRDSTFLIKSDNLSDWQGMFTVNCTTGLPFIFSDLTLQGRLDALQGTNRTTAVTSVHDQGLYIKGAAKDVQIYNCRFTKFIRAGVEFRSDSGSVPGRQTGVIYNNIFYDNWFINLGYGVSVIGDKNSWNNTVSLGTSNAIFVEDNYFQLQRHCTTANNGANYVARYNTVKDNYQDAWSFDAHGKTPSWPRGTQSYEIYNNTINNSITRWGGVGIRGGGGVVWGNTMSGVTHGVHIYLENPGYNLDTAGYPALDQIGNPMDLYIWGNSITSTGTAIYQDATSTSYTSHPITWWIQQSRDYYLTQMFGYTPYTYPHPLRAGTTTTPPPPSPPPPTKKGKGHTN
jgi:hypothetical protein